MRSRIHRGSRIGEIATFWAMIAIASLLLSGLAFFAAKYWVGGLMAHSKTPEAGPQFVLKAQGDKTDEGTDESDTTRVTPPPQAVVKVQQRAPTDAEKGEVEQLFPQDAADLHKDGKKDEPDDSVGGDEKPVKGDADADKGASSGESGGRYTVVASSYRDAANARREAEKLGNRGYNARIVDVDVDGKTYHRVVVGAYSDRSEANKMRDKLNGEGTAATVMTE